MKAMTGWLCAVVLGTSAGAVAQPREYRDGREVNQDRREVQQDHAEVRADWHDLKRLEQTLSRFDMARARNDQGALIWVDNEVRALLGSELNRGEAEVARDRHEVRRDVREVRQDQLYGTGRRDGRDDRRELHKDAREERRDRADLERIRAIASEYSNLHGRLDGGSLAQKRALIVELLDQSRRELHEDKRELRRDGRELRDDRRRGY